MNATENNRTILVIDDDVDFLDQQRIQLEAAGYGVMTAETAHAAAERLDEQWPDAVVVDLMMDHADEGFVLCHRIKRANGDTPVIMVTAVASETGLAFDAATREERSWIKADVVLSKPVRFEQLKRELDRLLKE